MSRPGVAVAAVARPSARTAAAARARTGLWLLVASLLVYNANVREVSSADTIPTRLLPAAVIQGQGLALDRYFADEAVLPYWVQKVGGHYRSSYPIVPGLLAVPVYWLPIHALGDGSWAVINLLAKLSASLVAALSVWAVYGTALRLAAPTAALVIAAVYAFGTATWSVSSQGLWGHGAAELFGAAALYAIVRAAGGRGWLVAAGVAAGLMVASRPATAVVALCLLGYGLWTAGRGAAWMVAGASAATLPLAWLNVWQFGSLQGGYVALHASHAVYHGVAGPWSQSPVAGVLGLLASPSRGLLVYSPVLLFAMAGLAVALVERREPLLVACALASGLSVLALGAFSVWWGGHSFGPRLLADVLPVLVLGFVPVWPRLRDPGPLRTAFVLLLTFSVGVQAVGAFYYPSPRDVDWNTSPRDVDQAHERLWDWKDPQLLRLLWNGPRPPGFE